MEKKKIKPLANRVLIQRAKAPTSKGGILLPDSAQEKPKEGVVIAVGPGKLDEDGKLISMTVKPGDKVLFSSYSGTEIDSDHLVLTEEDLFGILEN